jgi:hypothetical protein
MRSQSIKARLRSETSLAVLLIKTSLSPGYEAHTTDLASVVRAALVVSSSFNVAPEAAIDPIPGKRGANVMPMPGSMLL